MLPPTHYFNSVTRIIRQDNSGISDGVGALTAEDRDTWAAARAELEGLSNENAETLRLIDSALFVVNIDLDWTYDPQDDLATANKNTVVGPDPANRWFDKSISMFVSSNCYTGFNFEHSWGDGVAVARFMQEICNDILENPIDIPMGGRSTQRIGEDSSVRKLSFTLNDKLREAVQVAKYNYKQRYDSVSFEMVKVPGFGRSDLRAAKLGPDAIMQLAIQLAHAKIGGNVCSVYESCSTAIFRHGRTEAMRPVTAETRRFCRDFQAGTASPNDLFALLRACSTKHSKLTQSAAKGQGWDRHLFALKAIHMDEYGDSKELPGIFKDEAYSFINYNKISTSTLGPDLFEGGGFCPVTKDGYGIGYKMTDDMLGYTLSIYHQHANGTEMINALEDSLIGIAEIVRKASVIL